MTPVGLNVYICLFEFSEHDMPIVCHHQILGLDISVVITTCMDLVEIYQNIHYVPSSNGGMKRLSCPTRESLQSINTYSSEYCRSLMTKLANFMHRGLELEDPAGKY
jgi:hypothetical protein